MQAGCKTAVDCPAARPRGIANRTRFALGVGFNPDAAACALQPVHLANDVPMIESQWQDIREQAYNIADIQRYSSALGFGSDAPIESMNPFWGIYTASQRKPQLDPMQNSWRPQQCISVVDAIRAYTIGAAKLSQSSHIRGMIQSGFYADIMVLEDYTDQPAEYWLGAKPELLFCAGEIVEMQNPNF